MRTCSKLLVATTLSILPVAFNYADTISGTVSPVNTASISNASTSLAVGTTVADVTLCKITINNNYEKAFDLTVTFANDGVLTRTSAAGGDSTTVNTGSGGTTSLSNIKLVPTGSGTLGTGAQAPSGSSYSLGASSGAFIWNADWNGSSAVQQSTATVGYEVNLTANLTASTALLQGTYTETVTVSIAVGDQANTTAS